MQRSNAAACLFASSRTSPPRPRARPRLLAVSRILPAEAVSAVFTCTLGLSIAYLRRVQNRLYLLEETALVLLQRGIRFHSLLNQELDIPQLAEVEVPLALQPLYCLHELRVLRLKRSACCTTTHTTSLPTARPRSTRTRCRSSRRAGRRRSSRRPCTHRATDTSSTLPPAYWIVVPTREILVPVPLAPLQELEVILHLALDQLLGVERAIDMVFAEGVLQDLEVLEVLVFAVGVELDARHGQVEEDRVVDLAESGAGTALFDFGHI